MHDAIIAQEVGRLQYHAWQAARLHRDEMHHDGRIAAWMAERSHDGRCPLGAHVRLRVRWALVDAIRDASGYSRTTQAREAVFVPLDDVAERLTIPPAVGDPIRARRLRSAMRQLPARYRLIVRKTLAGWTQPQIGALLGCGANNVGQMLAKAVRMLREAVI